MGFFSWKCAVSKKSIPAYPAAGLNFKLSHVFLVLPDNNKIEGIYDGYGRIDQTDIYEALAPYLGVKGRDGVFNDKKYITAPDGREFTIKQFMWSEPVKELNGLDMNRARAAGYKITSDFDRAQELVRMVRAEHYTGQRYEDLEPSESCEFQGYFYDEDRHLHI